MSKYYGNIIEDATIELTFNTFDADGASVTVTDFASTDVHVHKDGGLTQSNAGVTIAIDFDGVTGNHVIYIDTSADAFYATGSNYEVRVEGITVATQTINAFIGSFSIENRYMRGTDGANTTVPDAAGTAAIPGDAMNLAADAIKAVSYDESTAFPLTAVNGSTLTEAGGTGDQLTAINLPNQTMDITGDITGNLSGSVNSVTTAVETDATSRTASKADVSLLAIDSTTAKEATLGTPANIDSGGATIADNIKKIADDNGGADFDATTDSLEKISGSISSGGGTPDIR